MCFLIFGRWFNSTKLTIRKDRQSSFYKDSFLHLSACWTGGQICCQQPQQFHPDGRGTEQMGHFGSSEHIYTVDLQAKACGFNLFSHRKVVGTGYQPACCAGVESTALEATSRRLRRWTCGCGPCQGCCRNLFDSN